MCSFVTVGCVNLDTSMTDKGATGQLLLLFLFAFFELQIDCESLKQHCHGLCCSLVKTAQIFYKVALTTPGRKC